MEKITNFKIKDFFIQDAQLIQEYLEILDHLKPATGIENPNWTEENEEPKIIQITQARLLSFGEVSHLRNLFQMGTIEAVIESISLTTKLKVNDVYELTIIDFYGAIASIKEELISISIMEENELVDDDDFDIHLEAVRANERMSRFGILNTINSLAGDDITKWDIIEKLPYMTVFTKLVMDKVRYNIQKELDELQKKKTS